MHRYETLDELWIKFKAEHTILAEKYTIPKKPNTCPKVLRDYSPWEMRKAHDSSCLCSDCGGMDALRRGSTGACNAIDAIMKQIKSTKTISNESIS